MSTGAQKQGSNSTMQQPYARKELSLTRTMTHCQPTIILMRANNCLTITDIVNLPSSSSKSSMLTDAVPMPFPGLQPIFCRRRTPA